MDEEELGTTGKKITIANFFESIKKIDKVASDALESSNKNFEEIKVAKETLKGLQSIVTSLQTDVQALKENDKIRENERKDRILEQQDAIQKQEMVARAEGIKGEKGDRGAPGAPGAPGSRTTGEDRKATPKGGGLLGGILGLGGLLLGSPLGMGMMLGGPVGALLGGMGLGRFGGKRPKPDQGKLAGGMLETMNPFARLSGMFGRKKDEKKEVKEEIKSEIKQELNLKDKKGKGINTYPDEGGEVKKENKLMNFVKQGGVAGFLGRKIFGKKEKENKAQEVGATNPENKDESYSESFSYEGRIDPETFEFIPDEGSLPPGVPLEKAQQDVYKSKISFGEFEFRSDIREGMTREEAIEKYGPQSNLYRFKENYNKTLEYGGYELDVGKHYDSIKNSMSGKKKGKGKGQDSSLKGEKRGIKGVIGGVADALTGGFFNFDKRGNTKAQDFAQGTADTLTGGIFDFDKKGSTKLQRFGQGFVDAVTGNLTDLDRKGGKTFGATRVATGMADFFTADMFDLDKRGKMDLFGIRKRMEKKKKEEKKEAYQNNPRVQKFNEKKDELYNDANKIPMETTINPDGSITSKGSGTLIGGELFTPGQPLTENQKMRIQMGLSMGNTYSEEIMKSYNMEAIKPVIESKEKDLSKNIYQDLGIDNLNDTVSQLVTQNIAQNGNAVDQNTAIPVPANEPQVSDAEIKNAVPNIPFISLLRGTSKKYSQITSSEDGSSVIAGYLD